MNKHWTDKSKGMDDLADRLAGLSPAKRALMELRLKKKELVVSDQQRIPQREKSSSAPLSFAQQRLWFLNQMGTGSAYNIPMAIRLKGLLNIKGLEKSLNEIIRRHEALRTTLRSADGRPVQVIADNISLEMPLIDLSGKPKAEREVEAERLTRAEAMRCFDLVKGPLFNAALIRLSEYEHILLLTMHHIVSDGWSLAILKRELMVLYESFSNEEPSPLPELPIQYADFAHWQREWMQGEVLENQLSYWRKQLEGVPVLQLFTDRPRPSVQTFAGASQNIALSPTLTEALNDLSQRQGVTLFMTLLAAFQTLLFRYTGQEDIVVGSPIANRNRTEIEGLIGFFVNSLAMRTDLSENPSFLELLGRVREVAFGAYAHQDLPFEKLVEELHPERDMSRTPLFQIMFAIQNMPAEKRQLPGLTLSSFTTESITVRFDIELHLWEKPEGLNGRVVYNTDLFDDTSIARLMGHYETLLESIVADPDQRISDVQILTDTERKQMLVNWNDTSSKYPRDRCVHELFEQQVEQSPGAVAVVYGDKQLTYRELNTRANQLALYLKSFGVGPEVLVGICLERSLEMIIAVLGILKAGGAYVPLDPVYPQERLAFMLADTQTPVLLTQKPLVAKLPAYAGELICLDSDGSAIGQHSRQNPGNAATCKSLAYVMYTSGSTGRPKGVCVSHRNVVRLVKATNYASLGAEEVFLQFAPISFDASTLEIWGPLLNGGRLVVFPAALPSLALLSEMIEQHQVTILWLTAGLFHQIVEDYLDSLGSVRQLLAGGDVLSVPHVKRVLEQLDGRCLINGYGPTENTTFTTCYPMTDVSALGSSVPIGRPIANTQVYILDAKLQPVPIGVAGELYTGGDGLGRGYLNRPELTAEKFIPDPFSEDPAARFYKTGDLARYLPDGSIEFMGRIDNQVKIRGFRIELGEVESVLGRHPAVEEAVVIAREDVQGDKRLVAYVVASHEPTPTFSELRSFLKEKLPDYMIPSALVFLELLPLTPNGKVDRGALPAPNLVRPDLQEAFVAPRSQSEELVAGIWSHVLGLERIGVHDSFFELGGHSLLVVQIVSRIREVFEVELPLRALFEAPTVAGLTERIEAARRGDEGLQTYPLQAVSRDQNLPLSFAQQRLWFLHQLEPDSAAYSMPRSIRLKGVLRKDALEKTYVELARRHENLRTTFHSTDGNPVLHIEAEPNIAFDTVDLRHLPGTEREAEAQRLSAEDARKPFDLRQGPLFRIQLFQVKDQEHVLHSNMHHIVSDFWSFGMMAREIAALYTAFIEGKPADLPELPVQYADYAVWQRQWLQGEALETQLTYWKDKLGGELPVLDLPTDRPRPAVQTHRGAIESLALPKELTEALQAMSQQEGVTLFMTLLAAFKTLLYRLTGQADIIVGTPIAGRNRTELEGLIGFFMNTMVMRTDLSGQPTSRELLGRVRETALGAYAHQDLPFERLVEELSPERDLSHTPLFQVFFNHIVAMGDKAAGLPGLEAEVVGGGLDRESKFDMTLYVSESKSGIELHSLYNTDLFDSWRMAEMLKQYEVLLKQIVENPDEEILHYSLVTPAVKERLPDPTKPLPSQWEGAIHKRFSEQAHIGPDRMAVVDGLDNWTYEELDCRSNQLAHFLLENSVQPGDVVAIYAHRSASLVWSLLGILKAGAAFLILDPAYPTQRLIDILQAAKPKAWFEMEAAGELAKELTENVEAQVANCHLILPGLASAVELGLLADYSDNDPEIIVGPDNLAYIAFTSGTTGEPKGIVGTHGPLSHFLNWHIEKFNFNESDRFSMLSGLSHDPLLRDVFAPLCAGATLCIPETEKILFPAELISWMIARQITVAHMTPALSEVFAEGAEEAESSKEMLSSIRYIFFGGDVLTWRHVEKIKQVAPSAEFVNYYGATETPQAMGYHVVDARKKGQFVDVIPLGKGIEGVQLLVLNAAGRLAGVGEIAEVHVRTPYLSKGYLNDETLTDAKFIVNPYTDTGDDRIYKTGDLGRYLPDGQVMFHGRSDRQLSLRGFRIELGEVEATLCLHPSVGEAVVVTREDRPGDKRLLAYVVATAAENVPSTGVLCAFLQKKLPDYMSPSAFVFLDVLPRTPNGKVDHRTLPEPDLERFRLETKFVAPRTQVERVLAKIWGEVLGLERVGVHDNFFELGGHSLFATQVMSRTRDNFEMELPLLRFFEKPTIAGLTELVETIRLTEQGPRFYRETTTSDREEGEI